MCCTGKPISNTSGFPQLDKYMMGKLGQTANQYPGPVSSQINPLMTGGANIMSQYAGQGPYIPPGYNTYGSFMPGAGGGGMPGGGGGGFGQPGGGGVGMQGGNPLMMMLLQQMMGQMGQRNNQYPKAP